MKRESNAAEKTGIDLFLDMVPDDMKEHIEPIIRAQYDGLTPEQQLRYSDALPVVEQAIADGDFMRFLNAISPLDPLAANMAPVFWSFAQEARRAAEKESERK